MKNEVKHLAHSSYRCEYHIVFAPKYRRREIYGEIKADVGEIIREYIRNQLEDDYMKDQVSLKEYMDPFTDSKNK